MWAQDGGCSWTGAPRRGGGINQVKDTGLYPEGNGQSGKF